ncbi:MAG: thioesterase family protein [Sulfuritalea sp.]|nr:thioesterase family protein [Sulfuritalea sp.]
MTRAEELSHLPTAAFAEQPDGSFRASGLTRGPWHPDHQHAGPPTALVMRAIERVAAEMELDHIGRLTANLLRPVPIADLSVSVTTEYAGRNAAHLAAVLISGGKEIARFTALAQRAATLEMPSGLPGHPLPRAPASFADSPAVRFPFLLDSIGYPDLVETRVAAGDFFRGPCASWFRMRHPLVEGEAPSAYQRVAVAADSGNGISAILDFKRYTFVNFDLTINLLRRPRGESICIDAQTLVGPDGGGLSESRIYDEDGLIGRGTQSLLIRLRD